MEVPTGGRNLLRCSYLVTTAWLLCVAGSGCSSPLVTDPEPLPTDRTTLGVQDSGRTFTMPQGTHVHVALDSNPSTGYQWSITEMDTAILEDTASDYVASPCPPEATGCGGVEHWEFTAVAPGATRLQMEYRQPWEHGETGAVLEITVIVQ